MRQAIHIFKKDVRHLRWEISGALGLLLAFAIADARADPIMASGTNQTLQFLLPVAWCFLMVRVMHAEAIPGDYQFWLTRPYHRGSLLCAKALFALVCIILPMTAAQAAILAADGLPIGANLGGLLEEQFLLAAVILLPAAVLASLTATLVQCVLLTLPLIVLAAVSIESRSYGLGAVEWVPDAGGIAAILILGFTVLSMQFLRRWTVRSWVLAACGTTLATIGFLLVPWEPAFAVQSWITAPFQGPLTISLDQARHSDRQIPYRPSKTIPIDVPLQATGIDIDRIHRDAAIFKIETSSGVFKVSLASIERFHPGFVAVLGVERPLFEKVKDQPVRIHGAIFLTELSEARSTTVVVGRPPVSVPGVGLCFTRPFSDVDTQVVCRAPFRWPSRLVEARVGSGSTRSFVRNFTYSPFSAILAMDPVMSDFALIGAHSSAVAILTLDPLSHIRYDIDLPNVRLTDYVVPGWL
jgi:hypothetical protein